MALHQTSLSNCTYHLTHYTMTLTLGQLLLHGTVKQYDHTSNTIHVFVTDTVVHSLFLVASCSCQRGQKCLSLKDNVIFYFVYMKKKMSLKSSIKKYTVHRCSSILTSFICSLALKFSPSICLIDSFPSTLHYLM